MTASPPSPDAPDLIAVARRITQAIAQAEAQPLDAHRRLLVFRVGGARLALPLKVVREVVEVPPLLSKVPRAPAALLGIMNLRGRVIAVVDLSQALPASLLAGTAPPTSTPPPSGLLAEESTRIVLIERGRREMGLLVEAVDGIEEHSSEDAPHVVLDPEAVGAAIDALVA